MGDLIGTAVGGALYFVEKREFDRVMALPVSAAKRVGLFATLARINALYMIARAGSGHIGSSFSSLDIMAWVEVMARRRNEDGTSPDLFFSSKGHDAPGLYSVLIATGALEFSYLHKLRRLGGLPGHPDVGLPNMVANTGSLGMGVSKAKGMIAANRLLGRDGRVYVLTGDGELQEGQFWESLISAANAGLEELVVIIDHNKLQSDTLVSLVSDLGDLEGKLRAFGWHVARCNGNDIGEFAATLDGCLEVRGRPKVIIADTVKGKGVSFMEHTAIDSDVELYKFHSGAPSADAYVAAAQELIDRANALLSAAGASSLVLEVEHRPEAPPMPDQQRLIPAYSAALIRQAAMNPALVALDADLVLDTGLIPFREAFPERFIECGIAEQDMVSQAGGMARGGLLPVVHSFACFLSSRPNEQIYNNATEHSKIVYVASLAGMLPGGPGHSHQAVRDISALAAVPGLVMLEPCCEAEVAPLLDWALNEHDRSAYLRLVSIPFASRFELPADYVACLGRGVSIRDGSDVALVCYGPVLTNLAMDVAERIAERGIAACVVNLPWLNVVDRDWLAELAANVGNIVCFDNHYSVGGQADRVARVMADEDIHARFLSIGLDTIPACGTNDEVLLAHGFATDEVAQKVVGWLR
jgi:transketolase